MRITICALFLSLLATAQPSAPDAGVALDGIAHVAFRVSDVARSRDFYNKLGFEQSFEFAANGAVTSYVKVNDRQFIELYGRTADSQPLGLMHVCFDMSDIERVFAAYVSHGLSPTDKRKARAGNVLFNLRDPDNQVVEYTQYMPGSLHSNDRGLHLGSARVTTHMLRASQAVKDLAAARAFYTSKLGFTVLQESKAALTLRIAGASDEQLTLEPAAPNWKPRLEFVVDDPARAAAELTRRGFKVRAATDSATVVDPDGAVLVFLRAR